MHKYLSNAAGLFHLCRENITKHLWCLSQHICHSPPPPPDLSVPPSLPPSIHPPPSTQPPICLFQSSSTPIPTLSYRFSPQQSTKWHVHARTAVQRWAVPLRVWRVGGSREECCRERGRERERLALYAFLF